MTLLAYFRYYQCQPKNESESMTKYYRMRTIEDPKTIERKSQNQVEKKQ